MIVRAVLDNPTLVGQLDYFNDAADTTRWLRGLKTPRADAIAQRIDAQLAEWQRRSAVHKARREGGESCT